MYRVDLPRIIRLVVALVSMVAPTGIFACQFPAIETPSEDDQNGRALRNAGDRLEEGSTDRLQIRVLHLRRPDNKKTIEQTRAIDLSRINVALIETLVTSMNVALTPFPLRSMVQLQNVQDGPIGEIANRFGPHGFVGRAAHDQDAIDRAARPVTRPTELKGVRIGVQQSKVTPDLTRALGAGPYGLLGGQLPARRSARPIDGAAHDGPSFLITDHCNDAGFHPVSEYAMSVEVQMMAPRAWQSLSPKARSISSEARLWTSRFMGEKTKDLEEPSHRQDFDRKSSAGAMGAACNKASHESAAADLVDRFRKVE